MAELRINIELKGAVLEDDPDGEVANMLIKLAGQIRTNTPLIEGRLRHASTLFDSNGNRVGQIKTHHEDET